MNSWGSFFNCPEKRREDGVDRVAVRESRRTSRRRKERADLFLR